MINANADSLTVSMTSGEILIEDSKILNNTYLDGTSGRIKVRNSTFEDLRTDMLSGSIYLNKIVANNVNIDITSGKAEILIIGNPNDYRVDLDITSGDIHYRGTKVKSQVLNPNGTKTLKVNGTSGDIEVDFVNE